MRVNKIYWIDAVSLYPVCTAGAVVIAQNAKEAMKMVALNRPDKPKCIGTSTLKPQVIVSNDGNY